MDGRVLRSLLVAGAGAAAALAAGLGGDPAFGLAAALLIAVAVALFVDASRALAAAAASEARAEALEAAAAFYAHRGATPVAVAPPPPPVVAAEPDVSIVDGDSGLPDLRYFELALDSRVAAARRHLWPVTLVLLDTGEAASSADRPQAGLDRLLSAVDDPFAGMARTVRGALREADIACRVDERTIGLLLEDTPPDGGVWVAERIQIALARSGVDLRSVAAGIATYPAHGMTADELWTGARRALAAALAAPPAAGLGAIQVAS